MAFFDADVIKALELTEGPANRDAVDLSRMEDCGADALWKEISAAFDDPRRLSNEQKQAMLEKGNALEKTLLDKFLKLLSREQRAKYEG